MIAFVMRLKSRTHFIIKRNPLRGRVVVFGSVARRRAEAKTRLALVIAVFVAIYAVAAARLVQYGHHDRCAEDWGERWTHGGIDSRPDDA
ncbi:hypothetical protein [Agrobacterium sp. DE0009]|uniref:hypothetical protein n=1 Tax=Agrobacterium sp. DE0009 TaxID=2587505 RepID=UPI001FEE57EC|nr:hypothetical protein [Agrobacterium sp. DE0009]